MVTVVGPSHGEDVFQFWQDRFNENLAPFSLRTQRSSCKGAPGLARQTHTPDFGPKNVYIFRIRKYESICSRVLRLDQSEKSPARKALELYTALACALSM